MFLTGPLAYMPEAVLAAVVFLIGIDLIDLEGMRQIFVQRRSEFWVALITALMVVFVGVTVVARARARRAVRSGDFSTWLRDDSSRSDARG